MGEESSNGDADSEIEPGTKSVYPNAGIAVDLTVTCTDCIEMTDKIVEMNPVKVADIPGHGVVYECPRCEKQISLGKYGHSHVQLKNQGVDIPQPNPDV